MLGLMDTLGKFAVLLSVVLVVVDRCLPKGLTLVFTFTDLSVTTVASSVVVLCLVSCRASLGTNFARSVVSVSSWFEGGVVVGLRRLGNRTRSDESVLLILGVSVDVEEYWVSLCLQH